MDEIPEIKINGQRRLPLESNDLLEIELLDRVHHRPSSELMIANKTIHKDEKMENTKLSSVLHFHVPVIMDNRDRGCPLQFKSAADVLPDPRLNFIPNSVVSVAGSSSGVGFNVATTSGSTVATTSAGDSSLGQFSMSLIDEIYSKSPRDNAQSAAAAAAAFMSMCAESPSSSSSSSSSSQPCFYQRHAATHNDYVSKVRHTLSARRSRRNAISYNRPMVPERNSTSVLSPRQRRLHHAVKLELEDLVQNLLNGGVDPSCIDHHSRTPLHYAVVKGNLEIVQLLLQYGASINKKDILGNIPLHLASFRSHTKIIDLLLKAGSDVNDIDCFGRTPISIAKKRLRVLNSQPGFTGIILKTHVQQIIDMMKINVNHIESDNQRCELEGLCQKLSVLSTRKEMDVIGDLVDNLSDLKVKST